MEGAVVVSPSKSRRKRKVSKNKLALSKDQRLSASVKRNSNVVLALEAVSQTPNQHQNLIENKLDQFDRNVSSRIQNIYLTVNKNVEAQVFTVQPQRKRQQNTNVNLNVEEGECKLSEGKVCTTLPNTELVPGVNHKVGGNGLYRVQNQEVSVDKSLSQTTVQRKRKGKKCADQSNTNVEQNPKERKCKSSDGKTCTSSPSTEIVAEFNHKVGGNGVDKVQNQEVTADRSLEDVSQRAVRKRKSKGKKGADQDNTTMEQNPKEGKCKSSDRKSYTSSPIAETVTEFTTKVGGNVVDKVQNQEVTADISLEDVSQTAVRKRKSKGKKGADQDNTTMEQNPKEGKCKSSDRKSYTSSPIAETVTEFTTKVGGNVVDKVQNQEVTADISLEGVSQTAVRKRKSKGKKGADQDNITMEQNPKEGKCKSSDRKSYTSSPIAETVTEFTTKVGGNVVDKVQNQEVTADISLEDVSQTAVRKRKSKSKGKKGADQDNTTMEQNPKEGKCKSSDRKSYTSSPIAETVTEFTTKVGGNVVDKVQNQEVTADISLEDVSQTAVRKRKSKGKKGADQDNTTMEQNPKEGKCKSSDRKSYTSSPIAETVTEFTTKVGGNVVEKVQNQEVTADISLEDVSQTAVRKRKSKGKKGADQDNTTMEQNPKEGKCKSSDRKSYTSSPIAETVTEFTTKVGGNVVDKVQNQEVTADISLEDVSQTAVRKRKSKGKKGADQDNTNMEQNPKEGKCKLSDRKSYTSLPMAETVTEFTTKVGGNGLDKVQNQEVTADRSSEALLQTGEQQKKRKRTSKSCTDQGNEDPLESGRNKLSSCLEKNHLVEDLVEDKLDHKVDGNELDKVQNQEAVVNKSSEASLQTAENVEECTVQQKGMRRKTSKRRNDQGNNSPLESGMNKLPSILEKNHSDQDLMEKKLDASDRNNPSASLTTGTASYVNHKVDDATSCKVHNIVVPVNKCVEAASQSADKHEEVCVSGKKRKRCADQENKNLLESGCIGVSIITNTKQLELENSVPERAPHVRRKLLILDLNGLLVDIVSSLPHGYQADKRVAKKALLKRPFCDDFLKFCFQRFRVGVWSSRTRRNVDTVVDYIMADFRHELLFCWDQSHCTTTGFYTLADRHKPLVLKELRKLWDKHVPSLPWEKGEYNESNTLLLDDSPYKALLNPPHTAIFPVSYKFQNSNDNSLAAGGDLRMYLEGLAIAENVQKYIEQHPFGQGSITNKNQSWSYYLTIINKFRLPA